MEKFFALIGSAICHQIPQRTLRIDGRVLPLCARCTGIHMGIAIGFLYFFCKKRLKGNSLLDDISVAIAVLSFLPFMVDGVGSYLGLWQSNHFLRITSGALAGYGLPYFFILLLHFEIKGENNKPIYTGVKEQIGLLLVSLMAAVSIYFGGFGLYFVIAIMTSFGVICFYSGFWALLLSLIFGKRLGDKKCLGVSVILAVALLLFISLGIRT